MYLEIPKYYGKKLNSEESIEGDFVIGREDRKFIVFEEKEYEVDPWTVRLISKHLIGGDK